MDWDARYRAGEAPAEPHRLVVEAAETLPPGRAVDLACGAGRNARFLASRGWTVTGVDLSIPARPDIVANLETHALPFRNVLFDLVIIINFLHVPLFAEALSLGRAVAAAIRTSGHFSLPAGELRRYFAGCRIAIDRDGEILAIRNSEGPDR